MDSRLKSLPMDDKKYTESEIKELLSGYFKVHETLFEHLPPGDHIRYFRKNLGKEKKPFLGRFKLGGFVKGHYMNSDKKKYIQIETKLRGDDSTHGYAQYSIAYDDIEEMWKKYNTGSFIEIHLIETSLSCKKKQIQELTERVADLETNLEEIRAELNSSKTKKRH